MAEKESCWLTQDEIQTLFVPRVQTAQAEEHRVRRGELLPALFRRGAMTGIANQSKEPAAARTELG